MAVNWQRTVLRMMGAREQPVRVTAVEDVLPWYRRVSFSAAEFMRGLEVFPTIWVRLWVPSLEDPSTMRQRGFTLVEPDPVAGTFALEFVLHEPTGAAASWAKAAEPGQGAELAFTPARLDPDPSINRFVLLGDTTAIPAINSLIDALPGTASIDLLFIDDRGDAGQLLHQRPNVSSTFVANGAEQVDALRSLNVDLTDAYAWAAGERKTMSAVRDVVRKEWRLPKDRHHVQAYWIEGKPSS